MTRHHYVECGLDNVYISGADFVTEIDGEECLSIPQIGLLHTIILIAIVLHEHAMSPAELRFLRIELGLTQDQLAVLLHCDPNKIEQWENGSEPLDRRSELVIRQLVVDRVRKRALKFHKFDIDIFPLLHRIDAGIEALSRRVIRSAELQFIEIMFDAKKIGGSHYRLLFKEDMAA